MDPLFTNTLFPMVETDGPAPGFVYVTPERVFSAWKRLDVDGSKPLYLDTCHEHVSDAIEGGYMLNYIYDYGFGSCDICKKG